MPLLHLILLAIIQGVTEFLPISSSAHLILLPNLTNLQDQGQLIDVAVHLGTLVAVMTYFWRDMLRILNGLLELSRRKVNSADAQLALCLIVATVPAVLFGLGLKLTGFDLAMRDNVALIGWAMLGFGLLLWWADRTADRPKPAAEWSLRQAIILGLWQALALIPGTSRSGITITGARLMGYQRRDAARLSMLMSVPVILAAGGLSSLDVIGTVETSALGDAAIVAGFAAVSAFIALGLMMRLLKSINFTPYVIYRVILSVGLILWAYL
ncbi:MAG: undecaprenyl-diphosphate phosphatase [Marinovum sp.]|nr:undecaprenyl-diphosphate phosphatase [Marinovum sp.]